VVEPGVEIGRDPVDDPEGERDLRGGEDLETGRQELDPPVGAPRALDGPLDLDDGLPGEPLEGSEQRRQPSRPLRFLC